jgi:hypothetical protein
LKNFLNLPIQTARIPPVDPTPATITAVLDMHAGHIIFSSESPIGPCQRRILSAKSLPDLAVQTWSNQPIRSTHAVHIH